MLIWNTKYLGPTCNLEIMTRSSVSCSLEVRVLANKIENAAACPFGTAMESVANYSDKCCH